MKIAVCFSGQCRTSPEAAPNLKRFFGQHLDNIDFFIHTWDINHYKHYGVKDDMVGSGCPPWRPYGTTGERPFSSVPGDRINEYRNAYKPKMMHVDSFSDYEKRQPVIKNRYVGALYYSWRRSVLSMVEYSMANSIKYDVVVKLRPDMLYPYTRTLNDEILNFMKDKNAFYIDNHEDILWISSFNNMCAASNFGDIDFDTGDYRLWDYLKFLGIKLKNTVGHGYTPMRPECVGLDVLTEFPTIYYLDHMWYSIGEPRVWLGEG